MIITDDTRRTILVGVFISLVVCLFLLILLFSMATEEKQTKQTRRSKWGLNVKYVMSP